MLKVMLTYSTTFQTFIRKKNNKICIYICFCSRSHHVFMFHRMRMFIMMFCCCLDAFNAANFHRLYFPSSPEKICTRLVERYDRFVFLLFHIKMNQIVTKAKKKTPKKQQLQDKIQHFHSPKR